MPLLTRVKDLLHQLLLPSLFIHEKYQAFRDLLGYDRTSHELIAELESIYHDQKKVDFCAIVRKYRSLSQSALDIISCLQAMAPLSYLLPMEFFMLFVFFVVRKSFGLGQWLRCDPGGGPIASRK